MPCEKSVTVLDSCYQGECLIHQLSKGASILALTSLGTCKTRKLDTLIALVLHLIKVVLNNRELVHFFTLKVCPGAS